MKTNTVEYKIISSRLPASFSGYRIVHLSDLHSALIPELAKKITALCPDLILITGDMVNDLGSYRPFTDLVEKISPSAPVLMSTGNHDHWRTDYDKLVSDAEKAGGIWLFNSCRDIKKGDDSIRIYGINDPFSAVPAVIENRITSAVSGMPAPSGYSILLFHRANLFGLVWDKGYDLVLSGHMHGGLIRIPGIGGVLSPRTNINGKGRFIFPEYAGGYYKKGKTEMIVSRGLGNPSVIPRIFNPPEIGLITLVNEEKNTPEGTV